MDLLELLEILAIGSRRRSRYHLLVARAAANRAAPAPAEEGVEAPSAREAPLAPARRYAARMATQDTPPTKPGPYWLTDQPGNRQRIEIVNDAGTLMARFHDPIEGDALVDLDAIAGTFEAIDDRG